MDDWRPRRRIKYLWRFGYNILFHDGYLDGKWISLKDDKRNNREKFSGLDK